MTQPEHEAAAPTPLELAEKLKLASRMEAETGINIDVTTDDGCYVLTAADMEQAASLLTAQARRIAELEGEKALADWLRKRNCYTPEQAECWHGKMLDRAEAAEAERDEARAGLEKAVGLLDWLNRRGGLGYEAHDRIEAVLASLNTGARSE